MTVTAGYCTKGERCHCEEGLQSCRNWVEFPADHDLSQHLVDAVKLAEALDILPTQPNTVIRTRALTGETEVTLRNGVRIAFRVIA